LAAVVGALLGGPRATSASTFVLMNEAELAARSVAAVTGRVTAIEAAADLDSGGVNTYVHIQPASVVFGTLPAGEIVLREIGGQVGDRTEWIYGSPQYRVGEDVLVFLSQHADGSLRTTALAMGKFDLMPVTKGTSRRSAARTLGEGAAIWDARTGRLREASGPEIYDLDEMLRLTEAAAKQRPREAHRRPAIQAAPPELTQLRLRERRESFTYLSNPSRWFEPDDGVAVAYAIDSTGDVGVGAANSRAAMNDAFAAWNNVETSALILADGGTISPMAYAGCAGGNRIIFNDPFNEVTNPTGCSGVLAVGGFCSSSETKTVNGTSFRRIRVGKIMFNNGWSSCPGWGRCNMAEVATHELGHTLGFGHSPDFNATMYAAAHFDGRCGSLRADDIAGATFVYPNAAQATSTPTATPLPPTPTLPPTSTHTPTPVPPTATRTPTAVPPTATHTATATRTATPANTSTTTATSTATWTDTPAGPPTATSTPRPRHPVRGRVQYYASDRAVPDTTVNLSGEMLAATQTGATGDYEFSGVPEGSWELAAMKMSDFGTGISPLDAAYVLQTVAQLRTLDATQRLACDTTGDGQLSALDAARILQFSVGVLPRMPVASSCGSDWLFVPDPAPAQGPVVVNPAVATGSCRAGTIMLEDLFDEATDQNFRAVLIGDCTGNWQGEGTAAQLVRARRPAARVRLGRMVVSGSRARLPIYVHSAAPYNALDLELKYDPEQLTPVSTVLRKANAAGLSSLHVVEPGTLRVAVASAEPMRRRSGALFVIEFSVGAEPADQPTATAANIDEKPAAIVDSTRS
jgi:hypothetical protein